MAKLSKDNCMIESTYILVVTTSNQKHDLESLAKLLIEKRMAACVQILGPITSIYSWEGKIEQDTEWQCLIKTRHELYGKIEDLIKQEHSYKVPEILVFPISEGNPDYMNWIDENVEFQVPTG